MDLRVLESLPSTIMINYHKTVDNKLIAELIDDNYVIRETQDAVDLLGESVLNNCNRIIIYEKNLHPDFFDLKTRLAGEILQKFSNYHVKLAIVGDFSRFTSKSLRDFIYESNKGNLIFFTDDLKNALKKLSWAYTRFNFAYLYLIWKVQTSINSVNWSCIN